MTNSRGEQIALTMDRARRFWRWFGDSVVVDAHGRPLVVYRGEHGLHDCDKGFQSRRGSLSFGSWEAAKSYAENPNDRRLDVYAQAPRLLPCYLQLQNPVINKPRDPYLEVGEIDQIFGRRFTMEAIREFSDYIMNTSNWADNFNEFGHPSRISEEHPELAMGLYFEAYVLLDHAKWVERLCEAGFDGAIHCGSGETAGEPEFKVFSHEQARQMSAI